MRMRSVRVGGVAMLLLEEGSQWKLGLKKFYGVSACSKWQQLAVDVECVATGLKPAYLLDSLPPNPRLFCSFLDYVLSESQRLAVVQQWLRELRVATIGDDVLVINKTAVGELFQNSCCVYVDISKSESRAKSEQPDAHIRIHSSSDVEEQCRHWYSTMVATDELQQSKADDDGPSKAGSVMLLSVPLQPDLNVCSLFGRLLGYPVVYWFPPSTDYCLDTVDLMRHQVTLSSTNHGIEKDHQLYSFSVPCCVESTTRDTVTAWSQRLIGRVAILGLKLNKTQTIVSLPTVIL